jgi:hypothetical protein
MSGGLAQVMLTFLSNLPAPSAGGVWTPVQFSTTKSIDIQRSGDIVIVGAPVISGQVVGIGEGQVGGQYTQQQISKYTFKLTLYGSLEQDVVAATDWIAQNSVTYFLNRAYTEGQTILAKMLNYGQILNERGTWLREIEMMVEVIVGL